MKIEKLYLIAVGTLLSSGVSFSNESSHDHMMHNTVEAKDVPMVMNPDKHRPQFTCPMHPEIIQDEMGSCPICGMDLVEKKNQIKNTEIEIAQGIQQNMNIKTAMTKMKIIRPKIKTYGKIKYNEDSIIHFHPRFKGWLESSNIKNDGQYFNKGDLLFEVYSEELIVAQQDYLLTKKSKNKSLIKASEKRLSLLGFSDKLISKIRKNNKVLYTVPFYAKQSGYIDSFDIRDGAYIDPNKEMFKLINKDTVWIDGFIFEEDRNLINLGDKVKINLTGSEYYESKIDYIYPELDDKTLALKVRITIENVNSSNNLKPNVITDIEISTNKRIRGLFIPKEALIQTENNNRVITKNDKGFIAKEVIVGFKNDKYAQILKGLSMRENVVTSGQFLIDSEASLSGAIIRIEGNNE